MLALLHFCTTTPYTRQNPRITHLYPTRRGTRLVYGMACHGSVSSHLAQPRTMKTTSQREVTTPASGELPRASPPRSSGCRQRTSGSRWGLGAVCVRIAKTRLIHLGPNHRLITDLRKYGESFIGGPPRIFRRDPCSHRSRTNATALAPLSRCCCA